jgi:hypothetical protein
MIKKYFVNNYLKITGIINNVFRPKKPIKKTRIKLYNTIALTISLNSSENWTITARDATITTVAEMKYENNIRIHLNRSENKYRDCKGIKYNPRFKQNTELQEKMDTCKSNAM